MQTWKTINSKPLIERMRGATWFMFITAHVQVLCFLFVFYSPSVQATIENIEQQNAVPEVQGNTDEEKLGNALQLIKENVADTKATVDARLEEEGGIIESILDFFGLSSLQNESLNTLVGLNDQVNTLNEKALEGFAEVEAMLIAKQLPDEIMQRHYEAVNKYKADYQKLQGYIQDAANAESLHEQQDAMDALNAFFEQQKFKRSHQTDDPNNLPFGSPDAEKTRKPITDSQQLSQLINPIEESQLAEKVLDTLIPKAYAQTGTGPTTADLAETIDVQLTDAIRAKAAELNNSPVEIYNWVRNNIEFIPSYGSIQGANYTLESLKGNAFDTSSLLIALLRAANIPARYAYGTVRIPSEQVMNWVGGVDVPEAAQQLLGQGGIPNSGLINGGQITHITMEHIWVEAWVDFEPSRAAENIQGDSWVPLDASFKQYEFEQTIDVADKTSLDVQAMADEILNDITIDQARGTVVGLNETSIISRILQSKDELENSIQSDTPSATVLDTVGGKIIQEHIKSLFSAGLPYELLGRGSPTLMSEIPQNLRHQYRFVLQNEFGNEIFRQTFSLPSIAGSTLALSFKPKDDDDERFLESFISNDDTDLSDIPETIPGYLINIEAEFIVDGEPTVSGGSFKLGSEFKNEQALYSPSFGWDSTQDTSIAGIYKTIGINVGSISELKLKALEARLQQSREIVERAQSGDQSVIDMSMQHRLIGDILQVGILSYFLANDNQDILTANVMDVKSYRLPSYGSFQTSISTNYLFGIIPRSVTFRGVTMDVNYVQYIGVADNADIEKSISFQRSVGHRLSAYEHVIPEQLFFQAGSADNLESISAVKALRLAAEEGQRISIITQDNISALSDINIDRDARSEISRAISAGKEATVHERPLSLDNWSGSGYLIIDPKTGAGAYKISGGQNGSDTIKKGQDGFTLATILSKLLKFDPANTTSLRRVSVALGFVAGLAEIFESCANRASTGDIIFIILIYTIISILMVLLLASVGVFAWLILSTILGAIRDLINQTLFYLAGCSYK